MTQTDDFLAAVLPIQRAAETAIHRGDAGPRRAFWSGRDQVTIWGAVRDARNKAEVDQVFDALEKAFSNGHGELEVIAADARGDLGYIVGYEHIVVSVNGAPLAPIELRVTLIFRREEGAWRAVHRHADPRTPGQASVESAREVLNR